MSRRPLTASHVAALALMPELGGRTLPQRGKRHVLARMVWTVAALLLLVTVVGGGAAVARRSSDQFVRADVPAAALSPDEVAQFTAWARTDVGQPLAPVVLTYHDIRPDPVTSPYVVTPEAFDRQMAMLKAAGYRTLTASQFVAYRAGRLDLPPKSVLITFDDGTAGLWRYADSVLQRYGFTAVSFVITGRVDTKKPYYLTWDLIGQMHDSGRWDFESHTANLHTRVPVDASGTLGGALSHRQFAGGSLESEAVFEARVRADLQQSISDLTSHGLPTPTLFAYPFSDVVARGIEGREAAVPRSIVSGMFAAAFVDVEPGSLPASRRELAKQVLGRAEIFHRDDELSVFGRLQQMATLPVSSLDPLRVDTHWFENGSAHPAPVQVVGDTLTVDAQTETYVSANWAPQRTSDWVGYTVSGRVSGLSPDGRNGAGLTVRVGSGAEVTFRVSAGSLEVSAAEPGPLPSVLRLRTAASHEVVVTVRDGATEVLVDGQVAAAVSRPPGPSNWGGFGVTFSRHDTTFALPVVSGLRVAPSS